jgi:transcriptional regulator with XRE-family HTH domain
MAHAHATYAYTENIPAPRIASVVQATRLSVGYDERTLAKVLGISRRTLRRWEDGTQIPSDVDIDKLAEACRLDPVSMFPLRDSVEFDHESGLMRVGAETVGVALLDNDSVLLSYVQLVRRQRNMRAGDAVRLRQEDVEALADALDLSDAQLTRRLIRLMGMTQEQAEHVRDRMLERRMQHPSMSHVRQRARDKE